MVGSSMYQKTLNSLQTNLLNTVIFLLTNVGFSQLLDYHELSIF